MRHLAAILSLAAAAAMLAGCTSYNTSFRTSFKSSFMKSCTARGATKAYCGCVEATLERKYSDQQLVALMVNHEGIRDAARACLATKTENAT
jgi:hypothetical protein